MPDDPDEIPPSFSWTGLGAGSLVFWKAAADVSTGVALSAPTIVGYGLAAWTAGVITGNGINKGFKHAFGVSIGEHVYDSWHRNEPATKYYEPESEEIVLPEDPFANFPDTGPSPDWVKEWEEQNTKHHQFPDGRIGELDPADLPKDPDNPNREHEAGNETKCWCGIIHPPHFGSTKHWELGTPEPTICWCGKDHGPHILAGYITCWCGVFNNYAGHPH